MSEIRELSIILQLRWYFGSVQASPEEIEELLDKARRGLQEEVDRRGLPWTVRVQSLSRRSLEELESFLPDSYRDKMLGLAKRGPSLILLDQRTPPMEDREWIKNTLRATTPTKQHEA